MASSPGSTLARSLQQAARAEGLRPLIGPFRGPIARLSGPPALLEEAGRGLPEGAAKPEAIAVRLRRRGAELSWEAPHVLPDSSSYRGLPGARCLLGGGRTSGPVALDGAAPRRVLQCLLAATVAAAGALVGPGEGHQALAARGRGRRGILGRRTRGCDRRRVGASHRKLLRRAHISQARGRRDSGTGTARRRSSDVPASAAVAAPARLSAAVG
jgi:hypothetical protein